jgi:intracellular septation protein A
MSLDLALQGLLPLIVFAIVDMFASMNVAIAAGMAMGLVEIVWSWYSFHEVDQTSWVSLGLILAMGLVSIRMKSDKLFKFQPVVMAVVFACTLGWFQIFGSPLLVQMMPKVAALLPEDRKWQMTDPVMIKYMSRLDLLLIGAFLAHGALVAWAAIRKTTAYWILARALGFYAIAGIALMINFILPLK